MHRKLQKTGGKSLTMTLPKEWVDSYKLKDKDIVDVFYQKEGKLVIEPAAGRVKEKVPLVKIVGEDIEADTEKQIFSHYIAGVSKIKIEFPKASYLAKRQIRKIATKMVGFDCVEDGGGTITLKSVIEESKIDVVDRVTRMVDVTRSMFEDTALYIKEDLRDLAIDVIERDDEVDKLYLSILRAFGSYITSLANTKVDLSLADFHCFEIISIRLEKMADCIVRLARYYLICKSGKIRLSKNELKDFEEILKKFNLLKDEVKNLDVGKAREYLAWHQANEKDKLRNMLVPESYFQLVLNEGFSRVTGYMASIADEIRTINYAYGKH